MSGGTVYRPTPDTLATRVGDEVVLVHVGTDQIYALNPTGARIWELLCEACDREEIERRLAMEFEIAGDVSGEIDELIDRLASGRLIATGAPDA